MREDNTVYVVQKAIKAHRLKVTKRSVKEFLISHPRYPSLMSVCDGLKKWNIDHYPLKLSKEEILGLEPPYIAHMDGVRGQLAFVEKIEDSNVTFFLNQKERIVKSASEFSENLSGGVIVIDADKKSGESGYREKRENEIIKTSLLPFIIISVSLVGIYFFLSKVGSFLDSSIYSLLFATKTFGIGASVFLVLHEFKVHTRIADKICGFSSGVDCDGVLSSDASRIFGNINLSDVGIIYFSSTLLYILSAPTINHLWLLAVLSAFSVIFMVYSIYYQGFRLRKWCPFCLIVQVALIVEFFILFPLLGLISITFFYVLRLTSFFSLVTAFWLLYKSYFELSGEYDNKHFSFLRFKSNPEIFRFLLQENGYTQIPDNPGSLVFGNPYAEVTVTAFLSLNCNPCANAFKEIKALLDNTDKIKICVILMVKQQEQNLAEHIFHLYTTVGQKQAFEYLFTWYINLRKGNNAKLKSLSGKYPAIRKIANSNKEFFKKFKITGTPTIYANGYKFPREYKVNDIYYFINEIKLIMESKGNEACSHCR